MTNIKYKDKLATVKAGSQIFVPPVQYSNYLSNGLNKMWYILTMEYYSALKEKKFLHMWKMDELESIMLNRPITQGQILYDSSNMSQIQW